MTLIACPACDRRISIEAVSCPSCGHPGQVNPRHVDRHGVTATLGKVAGTYISATAISDLLLGSVLFISTAAVLITLILAQQG